MKKHSYLILRLTPEATTEEIRCTRGNNGALGLSEIDPESRYSSSAFRPQHAQSSNNSLGLMLWKELP